MVEGQESLVSFIGDLIVELQIKTGVCHDTAKQQRDDCIFKILNSYGGQRQYIQTAQKLRTTKIADGWRNGRTVRQLAIDFDVTERQVYNIVAGL